MNRAPNNQGGGTLFARQDFTYDPATDSFQCPAGKTLSLKQLNRGTRLYAARAEDCGNCPLKAKCTQAQRRHISRHPNEEAFARMEKRLETHPEMMGRRRAIVEHPFGNLKQWILGNGRFLVRHFSGVRAEMAMAVQAYNLKRAISVLGARRMIELLT